jgi:hypothetical protein
MSDRCSASIVLHDDPTGASVVCCASQRFAIFGESGESDAVASQGKDETVSVGCITDCFRSSVKVVPVLAFRLGK